jgi:hypothetical protein
MRDALPRQAQKKGTDATRTHGGPRLRLACLWGGRIGVAGSSLGLLENLLHLPRPLDLVAVQVDRGRGN